MKAVVSRRLFTVAAAGALMCAAAPLPAAAQGGPVVIRAISAWALDNDVAHWYRRYIDEVNKRGAGIVEIKVLGGPEVVKTMEQFQALRNGLADMTLSASGYFVGETIEGASMDMMVPYDNTKYLKGLRATEALSLINQAYEKKSGVHVVGIVLGGDPYLLMMKSPIEKLDDLKGKRLRSSGSQGAKTLQAFGAAPVSMSASELFEALNKGIVDGAIRAPNHAFDFGEQDAYKYVITNPVQIAMGQVFVASRVWDKLPDKAKKVLDDTAKDLEPQVMAYYKAQADQAIEKLRAKGVKIITLPPAEAQRIADARLSYWDDIAKASPDQGAKLKALLVPYSQ